MSDATDELMSKKATSNEEELISEISQQNIADLSNNEIAVCANCGKEGSNLNVCNKCKEATYCNAACKKKHRSKHKKKCERRAAELHDIELFKQPPPHEDCPICMLPLPSLDTGSKYYPCCGKKVCSGCVFAPIYDNLGNIIGTGGNKCPFCRTPRPTSNEEGIETLKKRVEAGDATAMLILGSCYDYGLSGLRQDYTKALELWHKAGELGCAEAYHNIGNAYSNGQGVERDNEKADHYYERAAMRGHAAARHNLGNAEGCAGNWDRALKHWMISAGRGQNESVKMIQQLYMDGDATKEDYSKALQAYQKYLDDIKSEQRDKAAAANDRFKYY